MSCITIESGTRRIADALNDGAGRESILASLLRGVFGLAAACRSGGALAMMSERELDDLGLLPWDVRSEIDGGAEDRAAARRSLTPVPCNQA